MLTYSQAVNPVDRMQHIYLAVEKLLVDPRRVHRYL